MAGLQKVRELTVDTMIPRNFSQNEVDLKTYYFYQGDINSAKFLLNITHEGAEQDLSTATKVQIAFLKPDGKRVFQDCSNVNPTKGKYYVVLNTQSITTVGNVVAQIRITFPDTVVETTKFVFSVAESIMSDEAVESSDEFPAIQKAIEAGEKLEGKDIDGIIAAGAKADAALVEVNKNKDQIGILSENTAEKSSFQNNEQYIQRGGVSPKLIQNSAGAYLITTQKPNKQGYVRFRLKDGIVTTVESQGGKGEFLRVIEVIEVVESFFMMNIPSANSDPTIWGTSPINYVVLGKGQQSIPSASITTKTAGAWVEYQVATPRGVREIEALIYKSSGSSDNINISVDGINVLTGVSFMDATAGFRKIRIPLPTSGTHTVRFTTVKSANMTIGGVNLVDLKDYKPEYNYDYCVNVANNNGNQYVTSTGAMDYALLDADTNLWCGSYHGGETRTRISFVFDGIELTVADGQFKIFNTLEIEQETNIMDKVNTFSRQIFNSDGERELQVIFKGNIKLKTMFVNMATTLDTFTDVLYPVKDSLTATDRVYLPDGTNYVIQKNPTTNQKCITILNQKKISSKETPFIKKLAGSYCKVYNSNVQSETGFIFKGDSFRLSHIFN